MSEKRFTLQREVSIGDIAILFTLILSGVAVYFRLDTRLVLVEKDVQAHEVRIDKIESSYFVPREGSAR